MSVCLGNGGELQQGRRLGLQPPMLLQVPRRQCARTGGSTGRAYYRVPTNIMWLWLGKCCKLQH